MMRVLYPSCVTCSGYTINVDKFQHEFDTKLKNTVININIKIKYGVKSKYQFGHRYAADNKISDHSHSRTHVA